MFETLRCAFLQIPSDCKQNHQVAHNNAIVNNIQILHRTSKLAMYFYRLCAKRFYANAIFLWQEFNCQDFLFAHFEIDPAVGIHCFKSFSGISSSVTILNTAPLLAFIIRQSKFGHYAFNRRRCCCRAAKAAIESYCALNGFFKRIKQSDNPALAAFTAFDCADDQVIRVYFKEGFCKRLSAVWCRPCLSGNKS